MNRVFCLNFHLRYAFLRIPVKKSSLSPFYFCLLLTTSADHCCHLERLDLVILFYVKIFYVVHRMSFPKRFRALLKFKPPLSRFNGCNKRSLVTSVDRKSCQSISIFRIRPILTSTEHTIQTILYFSCIWVK